MTDATPKLLTLAIALMAAGCAGLQPKLPAADAGIPAQLPVAAAGTATAEGDADVADIGWRAFFRDPVLQDLIAQALEHNRDLRVAVLNVERARAQYRIQRADRLPSVDASAQMRRGGGDALPVSENYSAGFGLAAFELDLFGRVRNLSEAGRQRYFAQVENRQAAQISLVAEVATAYLGLNANRELQQLAEQTVRSREQALALDRKRHQAGAISALELSQAETQLESARAEAARIAGSAAQAGNALDLLVGKPVSAGLTSVALDDAATGLLPLPAELPSSVLLRRPDIRAAENTLRAANADIGAARAAFFPSITLTGATETASPELSGLFDAGTRGWSFVPKLNLPIFQGGRLLANLSLSKVDRDIALAGYERAIQAGFRDVADALALTGTLARQRQAQEALVAAAERADNLAAARYRNGRDSYLVRLDAERTLFAARQGLVAVRLAEQGNRISLYRVLGGGWKE